MHVSVCVYVSVVSVSVCVCVVSVSVCVCGVCDSPRLAISQRVTPKAQTSEEVENSPSRMDSMAIHLIGSRPSSLFMYTTPFSSSDMLSTPKSAILTILSAVRKRLRQATSPWTTPILARCSCECISVCVCACEVYECFVECKSEWVMGKWRVKRVK